MPLEGGGRAQQGLRATRSRARPAGCRAGSCRWWRRATTHEPSRDLAHEHRGDAPWLDGGCTSTSPERVSPCWSAPTTTSVVGSRAASVANARTSATGIVEPRSRCVRSGNSGERRGRRRARVVVVGAGGAGGGGRRRSTTVVVVVASSSSSSPPTTTTHEGDGHDGDDHADADEHVRCWFEGRPRRPSCAHHRPPRRVTAASLPSAGCSSAPPAPAAGRAGGAGRAAAVLGAASSPRAGPVPAPLGGRRLARRSWPTTTWPGPSSPR